MKYEVASETYNIDGRFGRIGSEVNKLWEMSLKREQNEKS